MANPFMPLVWTHLTHRVYRPWWLAPLRFHCGQSDWWVWPGKMWTEIYRKPWGGQITTLCRVVPSHVVWKETKNSYEEYLMSFFDKLPTSENGQPSTVLPTDEKFTKRYPAIWQFMTATEYAPGQPRERSSLTFFVEEGVFKFCLTERTKNCSCWASGPTHEKALEALEARITSASPEWRSSGKKKGKR